MLRPFAPKEATIYFVILGIKKLENEYSQKGITIVLKIQIQLYII